VDLASLAYQIWKNASDADPALKKIIPELPNVVFSTKASDAGTRAQAEAEPSVGTGGAAEAPETPALPPLLPLGQDDSLRKPGVMVYVRTADGNDALAWVDEKGRTVTESQHEILRAAACAADTPALPRLPGHHTLVQQAVAAIQKDQASVGGALGRPSSIRRRAYERLKDYAARVKNTLFDIKPLHQAIDAIYERPVTEAARDLLSRELRAGITDEKLAELVIALHEEDRLCVPKDDTQAREPQIICSLGVRKD